MRATGCRDGTRKSPGNSLPKMPLGTTRGMWQCVCVGAKIQGTCKLCSLVSQLKHYFYNKLNMDIF